MKISSFIAGAVVATAPLLLWRGLATDPNASGSDASRGLAASPTAAADASGAARADADDLAALRAELAMLGDRVVELADEFDVLRSSVQRRPAETAASSEQVVMEAAARSSEFSEEQRAAIADILERAREQEAELRAEERAVREEQQVLDRAGRIAEKLALSNGDELALAEHLRTEALRRKEIIEQSRAEDYDRDLLRDEFVALRDWGEQNLIDTFGDDLAQQIRTAERETRGSSLDRGRGGRGGGGGGGGTGGGGRGGGRGDG